jgi:hypothetical protein
VARTRSKEWYSDPDDETTLDYPFHDYDIISSPNDFNVITLFDFIERGAIQIPSFQRNYVWDIRRASKLIESLIIGLPIPQIFLYEQARNQLSVIDGQQRLMSIYYFMKKRFPRKEKRSEIRTILNDKGQLPENVLNDDEYFINFNLSLNPQIPNLKNKFNNLNYSTLDDYKSAFELRPIRSFIVKQGSPINDDSAIYEIFHRLNSGGVNLRPQEIRASLYHSEFYEMLYRLNTELDWRRLTGFPSPDLHAKDVEFILRGFAMLVHGDQYISSMLKFINDFSRLAKTYVTEEVVYLKELFISFLVSCSQLQDNAFLGTTQRFSITIFESVFVATCSDAFSKREPVRGIIDPESIESLKEDTEFKEASERATASKSNISQRISRAKTIIRRFETT